MAGLIAFRIIAGPGQVERGVKLAAESDDGSFIQVDQGADNGEVFDR